MTRTGCAPARPAAIHWLHDHLDELAALPRPGSGATLARWRWLADLGRHDLSLARLAEGHLDASAILHELGRAELIGRSTWGVWAAEPGRLRASPVADGQWSLVGEKGWCSGSVHLDRALVVATSPDGPQLFVVDPARLRAVPGSWQPLGMVATASETLVFDAVAVAPDAVVGAPDQYVHRAGFWHGGLGVAACWFGGALAVADHLWDGRATAGDDPHLAAARGRVRARLDAAGDRLVAAAGAVDAGTADEVAGGALALSVRLTVEEVARQVLDDVVVAGGAGALAHDPLHARRVADLTVYLRQLHRHRDEAALGAAVDGPASW